MKPEEVQSKIKELSTKMGVVEDDAKSLYNTVLQKYKTKYPNDTEEILSDKVIKEIEVRMKKLTVFAGSKDFVFLVLGTDTIRDYLSSIRNNASQKLEEDISAAVQGNFATSEGKLLDSRVTFGNNKANPNFRKEIGCPICMPLIKSGDWDELLNGQQERIKSGCNCLLPRLYRRAFGVLNDGQTIKKAVVLFVDRAALSQIEEGSTYKINAVKVNEQETSIIVRSAVIPEKMPDVMDMLKLRELVTAMPGLLVPYQNLETWYTANEDNFDRWFITETNIAAMSPTASQAGNRMIQFDDYEEIENMSVQTYAGYVSDGMLDRTKATVMARVFLVGNLFEVNNPDNQGNEKRLLIYNMMPLSATPVIEKAEKQGV